MERYIDEHTAETQIKQIMDLAANDHQSFVVQRQDKPAVVIVNAQDYLRLVAPDWLQAMWKHSEENGLDTMTMEEIDAEIAECRRENTAVLEHAAG